MKTVDYEKLWHHPAAYWFWHYIPQESEIEAQLRQMKNAGILSFQIAVRLSMPLEDYLSESYLAACYLTAKKAAGLGMMMGVYDEYNWLSGHAGGKVVEGHPELKERQLFWTELKLQNNTETTTAYGTISQLHSDDADCLFSVGKNWIYAGGKPLWDKWQLVSAVAVPHNCQSSSKIIDLTTKAVIRTADENHCEITLEPIAIDNIADYKLIAFAAARCSSSRMINYLLPEASKRFIAVDYEPYRRAFGTYFGNTVQYMFFDQPHSCFYKWHEHFGTVKTSLMASAALFARLNEHGELTKYLASLVMDIGEDTSKYRCNFFAVYADLGIKSFFAPLAAWCRRWGVKFSGHEVLSHVHSWSFTDTVITEDARCNFGMDYFAIDEYRDITAVDAKNSKPQLSAKMGDSVAVAHGRSKCLLEQYYGCQRPECHFGVGEWELSLAELRRQALRHHILGARQFLIHAVWLSDGNAGDERIFTNPRWDFAPGINYESWFRHYAEFARESSCLSAFLDRGETVHVDDDVLLVYPLRTFWGKGLAANIGAYSAAWAEQLSKLQYEYHFINEDDLINSRQNSNLGEHKLRIGNLSGKVIVLPYCQIVYSAAVLAALDALLANGVKVIFSGILPEETQVQGSDSNLIAAANELLQKYPDSCIYHEPLPDANFIETNLAYLKQQRVHFKAVETKTVLWTKYAKDTTNRKFYYTIFNDSSQPVHGYLFTPQKSFTLKEYSVTAGKFTQKMRCTAPAALTLEPFSVRCFTLKENKAVQEISLTDGWRFNFIHSHNNEKITHAVPRDISVNCTWEQQAIYPAAHDDIGVYTCTLTNLPKAKKYILILPKVYGGAAVKLNGVCVGSKGWDAYTFELPAKIIKNSPQCTLQVEVAPSSANYYYKDTAFKTKDYPAGIGAAPRLRIYTKKVKAIK